MNDYSSISSGPRAGAYAATTLSGAQKDEAAAKGSGSGEATRAKSAFMGRIAHWLTAHPSRAATEIKQNFFKAIGHMFAAGTLSSLLKNATDHMRSAKQLLARTISSAPPPGLEKWQALDTLKSSLSALKLELNMLHEQAHHYYGQALQNPNHEKPMNAAKNAYAMEAAVKSKVDAQEKDVADLEKALSPYKRPPAARLLTAPTPDRSAQAETSKPAAAGTTSYSLPANPQAHLSMRERASLKATQSPRQSVHAEPQSHARPYVPARGSRPAAASLAAASQQPVNMARGTPAQPAANGGGAATSIAADLAKLLSQAGGSSGRT